MSSTTAMCLATPRDVLRTQRQTIWKGAPKELSCTDLVVLNNLVMHADTHGSTFVRVATIAKECRRGERTVRRSLAVLRDAGLVTSAPERTSRGRSNVYRLQCVADAKAANDIAPRGRSIAAPAKLHKPVAAPPIEREIALSEDDFFVPDDGQVGSTHAAIVAAPPPASPYSDRSQVNDPPFIPPTSGGTTGEISTSRERALPNADTVQRVLKYFLSRLWPGAVSTPVTRKRRRLVAARYSELDSETAEQVLCDAVDGARLHPWHRNANTGFFAEKVFRDADTVEALAKLGRAKRLCGEQRARALTTPPALTAANPHTRAVATLSKPAISADQIQADLARIFGPGFAPLARRS